MTTASILTIEPIDRGGVPVLAETLYHTLQHAGHNPHLVYMDAESVPTDRRDLPGYFLRRWRPQWETRRGLRGLAIPRYPLTLAGGFWLPRYIAARELNTPIRAVACGSAHFGAPYLTENVPYVIWLAGLYEDELQARSAAGDPWSESVLTSANWPKLQALEARVLRGAAAVIGISPYTVQRLAEVYPDLAPRLHTVFIPVDTAAFSPHPAGPAQPPYLLLTARIVDPRKNTAMLFRAFARVLADHPDLRLKITGDPPDVRILAEVAETGVSGQVDFLGHVSISDLADLVQRATAFVLTSNQEGLSVSMLEALAAGVPVVSTRSGGPDGVIRDGETGYLTPLDDDATFAERMLTLLRDPALRAQMGQAAAEDARHRFAPDAIQKQLLTVFSTVYPKFFHNLSQPGVG